MNFFLKLGVKEYLNPSTLLFCHGGGSMLDEGTQARSLSFPLSMFLIYAVRCSWSNTAHTVCSHSLLNTCCRECSRHVMCQNNHGCTNQQPDCSWQGAGSRIQIPAAVHTVYNRLLQYLSGLYIIMRCVQPSTAFIKNPLYSAFELLEANVVNFHFRLLIDSCFFFFPVGSVMTHWVSDG